MAWELDSDRPIFIQIVERIQQGWPSSESIVQMRMDYGGVARKHPLLIFSAFFNPMYGQIIDWALEAMNVDLGKSD